MFEKFGSKPEKKKEGIYDHNSNAPKIVGLAGLIALGGAVADEVYEHNPDHIKFKQELSSEKSRSEGYHYLSEVKKDTINYLSDDFVSRVALTMKGQDFEYLIKSQDYLSTFGNSKLEGRDSVVFETQKSMFSDDFSREKQKLTNEEKKLAKDKIIDILSIIERAKLEVIKHLEGEEYLDKLAREMNISKKAAKEHQKVRVDNIKNISYELTTDMKIFGNTDGFGYAYYLSGTNKITLPYNINLKDNEEKEYLYEAIVHEILHESTMGHKGLSGIVEKDLKESFKSKKNESKKDSSYYSDPCELIVRKQILDLNMDKNGIKKYGDKFKEEHYQKLLKLKEEGKLSQDEDDLIDHIKSDEFSKIMNELAENTNDNSTDKAYQHPDWDYGDNA